MIRKVTAAVILIPIALVLVALGVANRHAVTLSYDPLGGGDPAMSVQVPLFLIILASLFTGVIVGGIAAWVRQGKWRKAARSRAQEAARWQNEADRLRARAEAPRETPPAMAAIEPPAS